LLDLGQSERAIAVATRALEIAPADAFAVSVSAQAAFASGQVDAAFATFRLALSVAPNDARLRWSFAELLARAGRDREAKAELEAALDASPDLADALQSLARLCRESNDLMVRDEQRAAELAARATQLGAR
jgi:tetratricopeptide (TPR) repeat protein